MGALKERYHTKKGIISFELQGIHHMPHLDEAKCQGKTLCLDELSIM